MSPIIAVKNFTKKYREFHAVDNVSFEVERGSIFAFLGPNGAGKSTTINTLCTILEKTSGSLMIDGKEIDQHKDYIRSVIGVVFQEQTLDVKMTVEENLKMHCHFYRVPKSVMNERIDFVLHLVDLTKWRKAMTNSLSGGMKRRVEIARSLLHLPKVLFLDEPTTGLDPQTRANIWDYLVKLQKEKDITIFLTTHYMDEAEISNRVAIMDYGKIIAFDHPEALKKQYTCDKAVIASSDPKQLSELLEKYAVTYTKEKQRFCLEMNDLSKLTRIVSEHQLSMIDLEIRKGTLNDVFLEITGKEIRE
ncbi:ABC transporter ATP-binding protein [Gracilibacillus alcaliphilus]|uniref:ABC transporter ATP-binding protein n=1 Tax=Gracilibacillus alcaliphilus TaxID=1401441 RepID=UPI00195D5846|nr:ATP-binding cassette domain-containing protein [Gracilibacillus alcaliphilus]MBM7675836.1 ABC-2 type transport system ATP-binding protein [Gracilibacillus alcaliphilus]